MKGITTRRLLLGLGILLLLAGGLLLGVHFYLHSSAVVRKAEQYLQETLGVPVRIETAGVDLFGSSGGRNIQIFENGARTAWLTCESVTADISALDLYRQALDGKTVRLHGAHARLRFDATGRLLTRLPQPKASEKAAALPLVVLEDAIVT